MAKSIWVRGQSICGNHTKCYAYGYWFVQVNIEPSLVVGWFKVELMRNLRFLWSVLCEEGAWVVNCRNRVDCEAMCGTLGRFCQVLL